MNALILVDLQNDFLPGGALAVPRGDEVLPIANALQPYFDLIVATQDWHPRDHRSFASQHEGKQIGEQIELEGLPQTLWPDHCVQETEGARFASGLATSSVTAVFRKGVDRDIDSYSGFFDNGHRRATGLAKFLHDQGATEVYVLGLATDYCVRATAIDAVEQGFRTFLIEDACRGVELQPGDIQRALYDMERAGVERVRSNRWLDATSRERMLAARQCILCDGTHVRLIESRGWEFATRRNVAGVVLIVPVMQNGDVVLVEQYREPLGRRSIEWPAGLVGDQVGLEQEPAIDAVRRELREETGLEAAKIIPLGEGAPSAGVTSEEIAMFLATGLQQVAEGGGDDRERIVIHRVPSAELEQWLARKSADGYSVAVSVYGAWWLAERILDHSGGR
jgi:nicotinamidase-related amidase/8-oxo-dGTP pyrophosphatase MutT (NUDIX family)